MEECGVGTVERQFFEEFRYHIHIQQLYHLVRFLVPLTQAGPGPGKEAGVPFNRF